MMTLQLLWSMRLVPFNYFFFKFPSLAFHAMLFNCMKGKSLEVKIGKMEVIILMFSYLWTCG